MQASDLPSLLAQMLRDEVRAAVAEALAEATPARQPPPALLTSDGLAQQLQISRSKLDELVREGLPFVKVGATRRYELAEVLNWLKFNTSGEPS